MTVRRGVFANSVAQAVFAFAPAMFGAAGVREISEAAESELAIPTVMLYMVPKWLGVWALASIFSAELSATDAILFMLSTSLAVDLYRTFIKPEVDQKDLLSVSRTTAVLAGIVGVMLAIALPSVIAAVSIFYSLLAVALFVPVIYGLYWRRMTMWAAIGSIFAGTSAALFTMLRVPGRAIGIFSAAAGGDFGGAGGGDGGELAVSAGGARESSVGLMRRMRDRKHRMFLRGNFSEARMKRREFSKGCDGASGRGGACFVGRARIERAGARIGFRGGRSCGCAAGGKFDGCGRVEGGPLDGHAPSDRLHGGDCRKGAVAGVDVRGGAPGRAKRIC